MGSRMAAIVTSNYCDELVLSHLDSTVSYFALNKQNSNLLVSGYLRSLLRRIIPRDIVHEFFKFYYESIPTFLCNGNGTFNYDTCPPQFIRPHDDGKDKTYCISQVGYSRGVHAFKMKIVTLPNGSLSIGAVTNKAGFLQFESSGIQSDHDWAFDSKHAGHSYQVYYDNSERKQLRDWYFDGIYETDQGKQVFNEKLKRSWNENDTVSFVLDCTQSMLTFYLNDKKVGSSLALDKDSKYYPAIAVGGNTDVVLQIVQCE
mmetsp:Transcript_13568/g.21334  ORF Transcript_13568/g.21334 Transcript_13568/m.21334 type:complete len:259 (-) Transcript_13568:52-828(-)